MAWKRKHTARAIALRPWKWVVYALAIIGLYDLLVAQFIPNPLVFPRMIEIPTRTGLPWQTWMVVFLVAVLILVFEGAHHYIGSFEKARLDRIHVELWGYETRVLPDRSGRIGYLAYSIRLTISNNSESTPLGIAKFFLGGTNLVLQINPTKTTEIDGFYGFGFTDPKDIEPMPHNIYLQPRESITGQLAFVHNGKIEKQKLYITDESGMTWTINIDGRTLQGMGKHRAEQMHELG
ncbi:hypothetical protein ES703_95621 [subsurface metagenome]